MNLLIGHEKVVEDAANATDAQMLKLLSTLMTVSELDRELSPALRKNLPHFGLFAGHARLLLSDLGYGDENDK